ncbi:helix-turn-helix transcriptional regulator [Sphingomonas faeni]|nr:helix-turn-helix transcriptional regulator [Sphingomonas faeni]
MPNVNPIILKWARETAGLDLDSAARKIGLGAARGVAAADRLAAIEAGEGELSAALLKRMVQQYHRPLLTFYLSAPPAVADIGQDFRTLPDQSDPSNVLLATLLRDVTARQALARDALEEEEDVVPVPFVGSERATRDPERLSAAIVEAIGFSRAEFRACRTAEEAFTYLRGLVEARGVFVLLAGDCGHHTTAIDVKVFRGFAVADPIAPFIVVNDQDAKSAWSFTLLHELSHLLLGAGGVSGGRPSAGVERLCNDTAAATLISPAEIDDLPASGDAVEVEGINALADRINVSRTMIAYQLFAAGRVSEVRWISLRDQFRAEWLAAKDKNRERSRGRPGPSWYVVRQHRLGSALLSLARRGIADGSLTPSRAARMLGVKPMNVYPLLAEPRRMNAG